MNILILGETSGVIRDAFSRAGHDSYSCDLQPSETRYPNPSHFQMDFYEAIKREQWDMIIAHPTCTALCVVGNHVYAKGKEKHRERIQAIQYTERLWNNCIASAPRVCFENPIGVLSTQSSLPKPTYVQPYEFGDNASKKTALYLQGLDELEPTNRIQGRIVEYNGKTVERWDNQTDSGQNKLGPSDDRWKIRSRTYQGIADAMVQQWG